MREILFRGKRIGSGEWVEGGIYCGNFTWSITTDDLVDPSTAGRYTGLTDKNGKRIFEGDILKDDWGKVYEVIFTAQSCGFMAECKVAPNEYETGRYRIGDAWCATIKVIGNIHDNPELVEEVQSW